MRFAMRLRAVRVGMFPCTAHAVVTDKRHPRSDRRERDRTNHDRARVAAAPERAPILRTRVGPILGPDSLPHVSLSYTFLVSLVSSIVSRVCRPTADEQRVTFAISGLLRLRSGARPGPWPCDVRGACGHAACGALRAAARRVPGHASPRVRCR